MRKFVLTILVGSLAALWGQTPQLETIGRQVFYRNEPGAKLTIALKNLDKSWAKPLVLKLEIPGFPARQLKISSPVATIKLPIETRLKPGSYAGKLALQDEQKILATLPINYRIGPTPKDIMPVVIWGFGQGYKTFQKIGFTHGIQSVSYSFMRDMDPTPFLKNHFARCDDMLADGFFNVDYFIGAHIPKYQNAFPRYKRDGSKRLDFKNVEASNPAVQKIFAELAEKTALTFKDHPALDALLINSEVRDNSNPSFNKVEPQAFRKFAGFDIPAEVEDKTAPHYSRIKNFPYSRVLPENDPLLVYYRWFWKQGDGWNPVQSLIHDSYKKHIKRHFWTFFDPAIRVPPVWGSGGKVDYLNHWTYAYPDPINIGASTSELQAMAQGRPGQGIMNMTQIICYRSATAPIGQQVKNPPAWLKKFPNNRYITLAPDMMRIALWTQLSRHTSGIMFHGWNSLITENPKISSEDYVCTTDQTRQVLSEILHQVVKPLGPTLKRVPERPMEVAILESFASTIFAGRGTWGASGWAFDANLMLMWANLAPRVVYEETLLRDGLGKIKVLVMPHCDVLPQGVFAAIQKFQQRGGLIVADEYVVPGITPDIMIKSYQRRQKTQVDKQNLQKMGLALRQELQPYYTPYTNASNPDLVTWVRSAGDADYLFVVNDRRTFGNYYGQYGHVMEQGLPNQGKISLQRPAGAVYSLTKHQAVPFNRDGTTTTIPVNLPGAGGEVFLVLPEAIDRIQIHSPQTVRQGEGYELKVAVQGKSGRPIAAWCPLKITVKNPQGQATDDTRYVSAPNGQLNLKFIPALNDQPGKYQLEVQDLASGKIAVRELSVQ